MSIKDLLISKKPDVNFEEIEDEFSYLLKINGEDNLSIRFNPFTDKWVFECQNPKCSGTVNLKADKKEDV